MILIDVLYWFEWVNAVVFVKKNSMLINDLRQTNNVMDGDGNA
jgi:hypothetical protein